MVDELLSTGNVIDMNSINTTYNNLLGKEKPESFKCYLKTLLEENVKNIVFSQHSARNQPQTVHPTFVLPQLIALITHKTISTQSFKLPK